jgi:hypothetical protein
MSLINDALKRASQSDRNRPRQAAPVAPLRPAADQKLFPLALALAAGIVLALTAAGWLFWQWWHASHPSAFAKAASIAAIAPKPEPPPAVTEMTPAPSLPTPDPAGMTAPASVVVAVAPPVKPVEGAWPGELKLMAIFFSKSNPLAMINGKTVGVGELIDGIRIAKIERDQVSVEWNGQVKVLVMK